MRIKQAPYNGMEWPQDRSKVRAFIVSGPDEMGRYGFDLFWWDGERKRAQCFHGYFKTKLGIDLYTWPEIEAARKPPSSWNNVR